MTLLHPSAGRSSLVREASALQEALGSLLRMLQHRDRDRAERYDLSGSQFHAIQALAREGPMPVTKLGDALVLEKSTASRLAKGLLDRGLVRKRSPQSDSRVVILQLTEQGQRLSRKILNDLSGEYMEILEPFDPEVRRELPDYLERLTFHLAAGMGPARTSTPGFQ